MVKVADGGYGGGGGRCGSGVANGGWWSVVAISSGGDCDDGHMGKQKSRKPFPFLRKTNVPALCFKPVADPGFFPSGVTFKCLKTALFAQKLKHGGTFFSSRTQPITLLDHIPSLDQLTLQKAHRIDVAMWVYTKSNHHPPSIRKPFNFGISYYYTNRNHRATKRTNEQRMITSYLLTVHHDGCFMYNSLSIPVEEIIALIEKETSSVVSALYWCLPRNDLESGLIKIENDNDLETMFDTTECYGHINIYIDHFGDDMSHYIVNHHKDTDFGKRDDSDSDFEEDDIDANSLDHLSEGKDEVVETRRVKAIGKNVAASKKQSLGKEDDGKGIEHEDIWKEEHEEFMEHLLKALKSDQGDKDNENDQGHKENENATYPIHDPFTHWKNEEANVSHVTSFLLAVSITGQWGIQYGMKLVQIRGSFLGVVVDHKGFQIPAKESKGRLKGTLMLMENMKINAPGDAMQG
ncbi:LOW QUALITY PROTEIN: hypothetical protein OSB04_023689 [Centaurea solstitialis]|uniref:Uncharacterized protein n=1 Tax=Centaurea solstitialis TaxID=347529 RepID=A0AA38VZX2_9ASTR|nr:LOW QUALITY PROTEIN: hypothetical protein OSB04_023689 [Centaurea solstitialis]